MTAFDSTKENLFHKLMVKTAIIRKLQAKKRTTKMLLEIVITYCQ